jgi:hypothetical protein
VPLGGRWILTQSSAHAADLNPAAVTLNSLIKSSGRQPTNLPASILPCRPVIHLNPDCMSLWSSGLQAIISAARISIPTTDSLRAQKFIMVLKITWWVGSGNQI